jgi:STE24 endopeptidase
MRLTKQHRSRRGRGSCRTTSQLQSKALSLILPTREPMVPYRKSEPQLPAQGRVMEPGLRSPRLATVLCLSLFFAFVAVASCDAATRRSQGDTLQTYPERPTPSQSAVPGSPAKQRASPEPPKTEQYTLSQDRYEKAVTYSRAEYALYFVSYGLGVLVLVLFLRLGVAAKFRDLAESVNGNRFLQGLVFVPLLVVTLDLFGLPVRMYGHTLSLRYEQSVQGWGSWLWDWSREELLGAGFALVLALVLFAVMRWSPRRWWFFFWLAALPILLFVFFISPWFIDPLFNKFEPLDAKYPELATAIGKVVQRTGLDIPREQMFLMEASKKTNQINAYVTGFGASKRVVVWDTTIQKLTTEETLFIFGHEAGHYVLGHIRNGFLFFAFSLLVALYLGYRGLHWALSRWGKDWKLYGPEDWAALAVILLLLQVMMFFALPIMNGFSRMQEHAADVYGLEVIHGIVPNSEEVAAHAFQVLGEIDLADPNPPPVITFWLYTHPPLAERLVFAHSYDPWSKGEPMKYVKPREK